MAKAFFTIFLLLLIGISVHAQERATLHGIVSDAHGPLPGVNIVVKKDGKSLSGSGSVATTDGAGKFSLTVVLPVTLEISYIGYKRQEVDVYEHTSEVILITLQEDVNMMNEVVVLGYAQQKRGSVTSAVSVLKSDQFENTVSPTLSGKLQGEIPGLIISSNSGVPGTSSLIRVRGTTSINANNDPIYIIDGVQISTTSLQQQALGGQNIDPLSDLNPDDIETVTVLKDASATAAYGAKGANGVILITTKRGQANQKTVVGFGAEFGFSKAENLWKLVTGPQQGEIVNEVYKNDGRWASRPFRPIGENPSAGTAFGNPEDQPTYDRISDIFRPAFSQKYILSVTGGTNKTNFYISGEINKQQSTLKMQEFNRNSFRLNLDHSITDKLKIGTSNTLSFTNRELVRVGDGPAGLFQAALHTPTFYPIFNEDGTYSKPTLFDNHQAIIDHNDGHSSGIRLVNNVYASYEIIKGLKFKTSWNSDYNIYHEKFYYNTFLNYGSTTNGQANDNISWLNIFSAEQTLNYLQTFNKVHTISAYLGNSYLKRVHESESITGTEFPSNEFKRITSAAIQTASSSGTSSALLSYFGGINYSYDNRYSIDFTLRADGSSRVAPELRWGYFPSIGAAWNIINEKFMSKNKILSDLRLKGSWGYSGNDAIGDFASLGLWSGGADYGDQAGLSPSQFANPHLKWETTRQWNIGFSAALFKNNIIVEFDYYDKYTYDLLLNESLPDKTGLSSITKNSGAMSNKGIELLINTTNIKTRNFSWKTVLTLSHNANKIEKLSVEESGSYYYRLLEGYPLYSFWTYHYLGVDPQTGNAVYENLVDEDTQVKITASDMMIVGNAWPRFEGTLKNVLTFKGWSLDVNCYFKSGNSMLNYTRMFLESGGTRTTSRSIQTSSLNYWKEENKDSYRVGKDGLLHDVLPRPKSTANADGSTNYTGQSSRFIEDASFIRLKNMTISYSLPQQWTKSMGIQRARLFVTASNLLLITKYTGPDPEVNLDSSSLVQGVDFGTPPQPRSIVGGFSLTF